MPERFGHNEEEASALEVPKVEAEMIAEFEEGGRRGEWLRLSAPGGMSVEGALYQPEKPNGEVVLFHPGMPGGGIATFENEFVPSLVAQGYEVFAARHNGLKAQGDNENLFHNEKMRSLNRNITGSPFTWFTEPMVSIGYFAQQNKPIHLITHSFSGISAAHSLIEMSKAGPNNPARFVKKWILPSASIWDIQKDGMLDLERGLTLDTMKGYCQYFAGKYDTPGNDGAEKLFEQLKFVLDGITEEVGKSIPPTIEVIGVYPESDKLVSPQTGATFVEKLPRGIVLRDHHIPKSGVEDPHDFLHAKANDLLRILSMKTGKTKHTFNINKLKP